MERQRDLKEYIVKLNDRNIQRQREKGFTLYAILGALIFCLIYMLDNLPMAIQIFKDAHYLDVVLFSSNALFVILNLIVSLGISRKEVNITRIFPSRQPLRFEANDLLLVIPVGLFSFFNFIQITNESSQIPKAFFYVFGIVLGLNAIVPLAIEVTTSIRRRRKRKQGKSIEDIDFTFFNQQMVNSYSIGGVISSIILSVFWGIMLYNSSSTLDFDTLSKIVKYVFIFFALLCLLKMYIEAKQTERENRSLEEFEKEIFFENISNEDIVRRFENDFDGIPFSKWIDTKNEEIESFFNSQWILFETQDDLIKQLDSINKVNYQYEYSGRLNVIVQNQKEILSKASDFVQRTNSTFGNLKNFSSLVDNELIKLSLVQQNVHQKTMAFNQKYSTIVQEINGRQSC